MMLNYKIFSLYIAVTYSLFGYIASVISHGMKGSNGPIIAAIFILSLLIVDEILIRRNYKLSQVNYVNISAILPFYFFSITLPLIITCPSPLSPLVAFLGFSFFTFLAFILIAYLIKRLHNKMAEQKGKKQQ